MMGPGRMLIAGCGNMGGAMLAGWLAAGVEPEKLAVLDPALENAPEGIALYSGVGEAAKFGHDTMLLGFKPQQLRELALGLQRLANANIAVHSLLGGVTVRQLRTAFPDARAHVRVMPNLAVRIGKSPVILHGTGLDHAARAEAVAFYDQLGTATWLDEEERFDLVTALAGSGPGFVYRFIDALAEAATDLGLERDQADRLALAMVEGASALAATSDLPPASLADKVASPGGMTHEGLNVLDEDRTLVRLLGRTLAATRDRGAALSAASD